MLGLYQAVEGSCHYVKTGGGIGTVLTNFIKICEHEKSEKRVHIVWKTIRHTYPSHEKEGKQLHLLQEQICVILC